MSSTPSISSYQAPLLGSPPLENFIPGEYFVHLSPDHSLEQHSATIHRDITPYAKDTRRFHKAKNVYYGRGIDDELLSAIRADPKVEKIPVRLKKLRCFRELVEEGEVKDDSG